MVGPWVDSEAKRSKTGEDTQHSQETMRALIRSRPASSNFCLGVWRKTGAFRYTLNHFGSSSDPSTDTLIGPAQIREDVVLDPDADTYAGTFTIDQYSLSGQPPRPHRGQGHCHPHHREYPCGGRALSSDEAAPSPGRRRTTTTTSIALSARHREERRGDTRLVLEDD